MAHVGRKDPEEFRVESKITKFKRLSTYSL